MVRLDIFSDPICPWCYIGKANLDRALESRPDHPFVIEWHPFQLNPDMPAEGMDRRDYLTLKFGNPNDAVKAYMPVIEAAEAAGLTLDLGAVSRTPNTLDAHRLIHWAGLEGRQSAVVAALFRAYFQQGRDIGDALVLTDIAGTAGMDADVAARLLATDADMEAIRERDRHPRARGIQGVPCFVVADTHVVSGAQPVRLWQDVIDEITRKEI
ncbi:DsbA family oxidoreductase [Roseicitreum antarcticum]|uniref:Predicted dithiol-disulfide isomerase, DsbA family n=1 Tax=Roseicitreum antarcticum TaxID=564137 RepID=A0A1H3CHM8_9RHOB|nr:DsbA family oxidoreductase [Roseicitreum antarcticum]SDX53633.1 Predicted dithiol-disulfide isomerase, DsbA family [Roseicitreum antarcticum]